MGGVLYYLRSVFAVSLASGSPFWTKLGALGILIAVSMVVYFAVAFLIGGADLVDDPAQHQAQGRCQRAAARR